MNRNKHFLNIVLAAVLGASLLAAILIRTFFVTVILPEPSIPGIVLISLIALVIDGYIAPGKERCYWSIAGLSAAAFGLLPWAAGFATAYGILVFGVSGGVMFTITTFLFTSISQRISSGPSAKMAPVISALGLYLASQCFASIFF